MYDGHVEPGGPSRTRTVSVDGREVEILKLSVGPMDNNAYLLTDVDAGESLLIDAANDASHLLEVAGDRVVTTVLTTHGHADHWQALEEVAHATGASPCHHPADAARIPLDADVDAADGTTITFGAVPAVLLHTPGHTPGSTCLLLEADDRPHLFTGDTLFPGGPGNTFGDDEAFATIMRSLDEKLFVLPDETWVYPGHGDDTTIGAERPHLEEWRERGW